MYLLRHWNRRTRRKRSRQDLEVQKNNWLTRRVVCRVADVAGFEEAITGPVDCRLVGLHIGQFSNRDATDARTKVMVWPYVASRIVGDLCYPKLISPVEF